MVTTLLESSVPATSTLIRELPTIMATSVTTPSTSITTGPEHTPRLVDILSLSVDLLTRGCRPTIVVRIDLWVVM